MRDQQEDKRFDCQKIQASYSSTSEASIGQQMKRDNVDVNNPSLNIPYYFKSSI